MTGASDPDDRGIDPDDRERTPPGPRWALEAGIGLVVALLLAWVAVAAVSDVPFVYQGL